LSPILGTQIRNPCNMSRKSDKIRAYLQGPKEWSEGYVLFQQFGKNRALKRIFEKSGQTSYNHQRLIDELRLLVPDEKQEKKAEANRLDAVAKDDPRIIPLYRERQHLHAQLMVLPNDLQRKQAAFRIVEITRLLDKLQAGEVPLENRIPQSEGDILKKLLNNRSYISKNKGKPEKQRQVQERIAENQKIEKLLKQ